MNKFQPFLSKTKYLDGIKCPKLLWYEFNDRGAVPPPDPATQAVFEQGRRVGELAQKLYPDGIRIVREPSPYKTQAKTVEALKMRRPLFEAGLIYGRTYALPDILVPVEGDGWDIIEVKSGTKVDEIHLMDVAFQKYVYTGAGLDIRRCYLMHIDPGYIRNGEIEPEKLFALKDITEEIKPYQANLEKNIKELQEIVSGREPEVKIGSQCGSPYACPLKERCWGFLPKGNVLQLRGKKERLYALLDQGILKLSDIPIEDWLNDKQLLQIESHRTGEAHVDREAMGAFLSELKYPLYFLDFETLSAAVPAYDLTHPFENIFFQFSLHVIPGEGEKPAHYGYLAPDRVDPRLEILKRLRSILGDSGTILAYSMSFEIGCLKNAAEAYPEYKDWVGELEGRFVDLLVPFKKFYYYHPAQEGSASIKKVLPAMTGKGYAGMEIADGGTASLEYERVTFGEKIEESDRQQVRQALEKYCELDTQAMVEVLAGLKRAGMN